MSDTRLVCPHCNTINLLPKERLGDSPRCGKCHEDVFDSHPVELGSASFDRHVMRNDIPTLVDFWAPWCGPCLAMAPAYEEAASVLEPDVRLAKLNTEEHQAIGARYGIRSIPTMIIFRDGEELARHSGAMMAGDIVQWVQSQLVTAT
jgi:thioredoxin 2